MKAQLTWLLWGVMLSAAAAAALTGACRSPKLQPTALIADIDSRQTVSLMANGK